ncbi:MAG: bifunctional anthranilate synthase component I family protein/class IV aminotransferase [Spirochaetia bacterium]|nr:bifunctional anthranilate synthase component I family protein/class IV aminotransferase [Spirochaetia bacterium]
MRNAIPKEISIIVSIDNKITNKKNYLFKDAAKTIIANNPSEIESALNLIDEYTNQGKYLCGYFSYEASCYLKGLHVSLLDNGMPMVWFGVFDNPILIQDEKVSNDYYLTEFKASKDFKNYSEGFKKIKKYIEDGVVYQINYTFGLHFSFYGDQTSLFYDLKQNQKSSYNFMFSFDDKHILSLSPELLFYKNNRKILTKPMKGTISRNSNPIIDQANKEKLRNSLKNKAENAMITDILRNDLGIICEHGTIQVEKYLEIEEYPTLYQMTSTVSGTLKKEIRYKEIFKAMFPIASITGAPKIEAMKKISEIENEKRGIYTGAIGIIQPNGEAIFNVAIRTLELNKSKGRICVGSGIVYDSDEIDEYNESLLKASFITLNKKEFYLFETMLFKHKKITLLNLHLERLKKSAIYFNFRYYEDKILTAINEIIVTCIQYNKNVRIKLKLYPDGKMQVEHKPVENIFLKKNQPYRLALSNEKINSKDVFNYHKTNLRQLKDEKYRGAIDLGFNEVIFINEKDEVTECCVHNIAMESGGRWYTPPLISGLLPGTFRQYLLNKKYLVERKISMDDLKKADKILLINSVRGFNQGELSDQLL